jgi:hypothetical protein
MTNDEILTCDFDREPFFNEKAMLIQNNGDQNVGCYCIYWRITGIFLYAIFFSFLKFIFSRQQVKKKGTRNIIVVAYE